MNRTSTYITTLQKGMTGGLVEATNECVLNGIRSAVKNVNAELRSQWKANPYSAGDFDKPVQFQVHVKGRLGKNNPHSSKYSRYGSRAGCLKQGNVLLSHAGYFDVYIHQRSRW
jgi:outer membrane receptor for ferrienterochelin and colicin